MPQQKKIPMRMCKGCNEMKPKKELIRIVKNKDGEISVDLTGKKSGRGVYVCKSLECFLKAKKSKRFEKDFECQISEELYGEMENELRKLTESN